MASLRKPGKQQALVATAKLADLIGEAVLAAGGRAVPSPSGEGAPERRWVLPTLFGDLDVTVYVKEDGYLTVYSRFQDADSASVITGSTTSGKHNLHAGQCNAPGVTPESALADWKHMFVRAVPAFNGPRHFSKSLMEEEKQP